MNCPYCEKKLQECADETIIGKRCHYCDNTMFFDYSNNKIITKNELLEKAQYYKNIMQTSKRHNNIQLFNNYLIAYHHLVKQIKEI